LTAFLICASARTGTNLLATALRRTGVAGRPLEYFSVQLANKPFMRETLGLAAAQETPPDFAARLPMILRAGRSSNGIFGATVHWVQLKNVLASIGLVGGARVPAADPRALAALRANFPGLRFIQLTRENKVAQAISHYRAIQSGRWSESVHEPASAAPADLEFDYEAILRLTRAAETDAACWQAFLAEAEATTLRLTYEGVSADFGGTVRQVLDFLEIPTAGVEIPPPNYRRQADATSLAWEARFRRQTAAA
jgi:LPS sulfotransferase NodH